jgi:MerR family copper efflux transcriptional regulator
VELTPIDEVARRLGLAASAIRYYEERGLVTPRSRHSGRRWFGPSEIRRLAVIGYWQRSGLMSLDEIAEILDGPAAARPWTTIVEDRIGTLTAQVEAMTEARDLLEHVLAHHRDSSPDGCPHYEALIWNHQPLPQTPAPGPGSARQKPMTRPATRRPDLSRPDSRSTR